MSDLVAFLKARLDEDEAMAKGWAEPGGSHWPWLEARVLREVEAKRRMLEELDLPYPDEEHLQKLLAAVYSDHPGYDPAWAVT